MADFAAIIERHCGRFAKSFGIIGGHIFRYGGCAAGRIGDRGRHRQFLITFVGAQQVYGSFVALLRVVIDEYLIQYSTIHGVAPVGPAPSHSCDATHRFGRRFPGKKNNNTHEYGLFEVII